MWLELSNALDNQYRLFSVPIGLAIIVPGLSLTASLWR